MASTDGTDHYRSLSELRTIIQNLESEIEASGDTPENSSNHLELGRLYEEGLVNKAKAIVHYQRAFKLDTGCHEALSRARNIYWQMGRLHMVEKLLDLQIQSGEDESGSIFWNLGSVRCDLQNIEGAVSALREAVARDPDNSDLSEELEDALAADGWQDRAAVLEKNADAFMDEDPLTASKLFLRAARIHRTHGQDAAYVESVLRKSILANPMDEAPSVLYEGMLVEESRMDDIQQLHDEILAAIDDDEKMAETLFTVGLRWVLRLNEPDRALDYLAEATNIDRSKRMAVLSLLRQRWAEMDMPNRTLEFIEHLRAGASSPEEEIHLLEEAVLVCLEDMNDEEHAAHYREELSALSEAAEGEEEAAPGAEEEAAPEAEEEPEPEAEEEAAPEAEEEPEPEAEVEAEPEAEEESEPEPEPEPEPDVEVELTDAARDLISQAEGEQEPLKAADFWKKAWNESPGAPEIIDGLINVYSELNKWPVVADFLKKGAAKMPDTQKSAKINVLKRLAKIYDQELNQDVMVVNTYQAILKIDKTVLDVLDAAVEKYEAMNRWPDVVKMLSAKAEAVEDPTEKIDLWSQVAILFKERFSNQAEAIKAFEKVIEIDETNEEAIGFLREMYEKRRDWEKLIGVMKTEATMMDDVDERTAKYVEIAQLATERIKRPQICIELWNTVLENDPAQPEALEHLSKMYERTKDWENLADVLSRQVENEIDAGKQAEILFKLGIVYGDKIKNDEKSVEAWKSLLEINPDDRRAQDQLKKRYVAIRAWDELEEFYEASQKWDEFIRILEKEADASATSPEDRVTLLFKVAQLWMERRNRPDRAALTYEKILSVEPSRMEAAEALIPMYEESGEQAKLVNVLYVKLNAVEDEEEKIEISRRIGSICEEELGDHSKAFDSYLKVFEIRPDDLVSREDLERSAGKSGRWDETAAAMEAALGDLSGEDLFDAQLRLGRVLDEELGQPEKALDYFAGILEEDPQNVTAVTSLEKIYAQMGRYEELLDIYEKRIEIITDFDEKKEIMYNMALLWEEEIRDPEQAINAYRNILEFAGEDARALKALDRLYLAAENYSELASVLDQELGIIPEDPSETHDIKYRLGRVYQQHLDRMQDAMECFRDILDAEPSYDAAREGLEELLENDELKGEAAAILEPIYEQSEDWQKLINVQKLLLDTAESDMDRIELYKKIAVNWSQKLGNAEEAFSAYANAMKLDPADQDVTQNLKELAEVLDNYKELADLWRQAAADLGAEPQAVELWTGAAHIYDVNLDDLDAAIDCYTHILEIDDANETALTSLEQIYNRTERWSDLVQILRRRVDTLYEADEKEAILQQMALIFEEMLEQPEQAVECYNEIRSISPASAGALESLDRLYQQLEKWPELADVLQQELEETMEPDQQVSLKLRLASLRETRMEQPDVAVELYRQVLETEPDNSEALSALENLVSHEDLKYTVAQILEPLYRDLGEWEKLIDTYNIMIEAQSEPFERIAYYHKIAELYEVAGDNPEKAFETFARALEEAPDDEQTLDNIRRLARAMDAYEDLVGLFERRCETLEDMDLKVRYHMDIAGLREEELHDVEGAIGHFNKVLEILPGHLDALTALERAYQITENYEELCLVYRRKSDILDDVDEKKEMLFKAGQLYEEILDQPEKAVDVYRLILDIDTDDLHALGQLEALFLRMEKWEDLQEVYNRKVDLLIDPDEKKEVLYVLGAMYEREVNDTEKAIDTYQRILELDPQDFQALQRLDILFGEQENWHDLLSILEKEAEFGSDPDEVISFKFRIGELWEKHLDDAGRAVEMYREITDVVSDHQPTLEALDRLLHGDEEPVRAAEVLAPIYQESGDWRKLVDVYEVQIKHSEEDWQKLDLLHKEAELLESELYLDSPEEAFKVYARALSEEPTNQKTLDSMEKIAQAVNSWAELADLLDEQMEKAVDGEHIVELAMRVAKMSELNLSDEPRAIARYKKVLEIENENRDAIEALDRLLSNNEMWDDLADILRKKSFIAESPEDSLDIQFRLGRLYQEEINDIDQAIESYRGIVDSAPEYSSAISALELLFTEGVKRSEIIEILEPLYRTQGEWGRLTGLYEVQVDEVEDTEDKIGIIQQIAEIFEEKLADQVEAFNWYGRAFTLDPFNERAGEELERLAGATDGWQELADTCSDILNSDRSNEIKMFTGKKLARVNEEELRDIQKAEEVYRNLLNIDGSDAGVLEALDRIYEKYLEWDSLVAILKRRADMAEDDVEKTGFVFRRGRVLQQELGETEMAAQCFREIIDDLDPQHMEALEHLEIIYADAEEWAQLSGVYEKMLDIVPSDTERADLYAKMATIAVECLEELDRGAELWKNVIDIRGEDRRALESLGDIFARQEQWSDLVDVLERAVVVADDDESKIRIYSQMGLVWGECLGRDQNALDNWENVLMIDATNSKALEAIAGIHRSNQEWDALIETLLRLEDIGNMGALTEEQLRDVYAQMGRLYTETLDQPLDAIDVWNKVLDINPLDREALDELEKLYVDSEQWTECVRILKAKANSLEDGQEKVDVLLKMAEMIEDPEKVGEPHDAREGYEQILEIEPTHIKAFEKLETILEETEEWEPLTQVYFKRLDHTEEVPGKVDLLLRIAKVYEDNLDQADAAFMVLQKAFEIDYTNDETAARLEKLASSTGKWNDLLSACNQVLPTITDQDVQIALCLKIGKWYADEVGHPEYGEAYYRQVLQMDADNTQALSQMGDLYRKTKQWDSLVNIMQQLVEAEQDDSKKADALVDLGEIYEERLDNIPEAKIAFKKAVELDPSHTEGIKALERLFGAQQNWRELIPILKRKLDMVEDPEETMELLLHMGSLMEERLDDADGAIDKYRKVLEIDESSQKALKGLERLYEKQEKWQDLVDILEMELEIAETDRNRISYLSRIAGILEEQFVKLENAAERWEEVLDIHPSEEDALNALQNIYGKTKNWEALIRTYERHIEAISNRMEKIELLLKTGETYSHELDQSIDAVEAYKRVLDIDPDHEKALDELARLSVKLENWSEANDALLRLAEVLDDNEKRVDLYYRLGKLNEKHLLDRANAIEQFRQAIDLNPAHLDSLEALRDIYIEEREWVAAVKILQHEAEHAQSSRQKALRLCEIGNIQEEHLQDHDAAIAAWESGVESDPENQNAALPLVSEYIEKENWEQAEPLLEMLIRMGAKRPAEERKDLHTKMGLVARKMGNLDRALDALKAAYEIDSTDLPTLLGVAGLHYEKEQWDKAFKFYQMILVHHRDKQSESEIVDIFYRLGHIKHALDERRKALNMFDKALEINPAHRPTLEEVIELHTGQRNYEQVIHFKKSLVECAKDDEERFDILMEIGDLWQQKLKNQQKAIKSYLEAKEIKDQHHILLHKLLQLYTVTKQWQNAVEIIEQVASIEEDIDRLAKYYYSMGVIYRDEIKNAEKAVELFNLSLDTSLENLKAFEAVDRILTQQKDWKALERNYRKMLKRISGKGMTDVEVNLWHFLGEIYRTRIGNFEASAEAFRMASRLSPDNVMRHEILAELFSTIPDKAIDAVEEFQWLIRNDPYRIEPYKALRKLYFESRQYDKAWCLCAVLAFLKKADAEEQQFFEQYRTRGVVRAQARLDNERWIKDLFHPDEDLFIGKIFEAVLNAVRTFKIQPIKAFGLKKKEKRDPNTDTVMLSKTFGYTAQVLNIPVMPDLYLQPDQPGVLRYAITDPMASVAGANVLSGYSPQDTAFMVAKHLSYYRPEHYIRWILPSHAELRVLLLAAIKLVEPAFKTPSDPAGTLDQWVAQLRKQMTPAALEALQIVVRKLIQSGKEFNIKEWLNATELTACRTGFLLCNDLEVAAKMIQSETSGVGELTPKDKLKDLILFGASESYFSLREHLGIQIGA